MAHVTGVTEALLSPGGSHKDSRTSACGFLGPIDVQFAFGRVALDRVALSIDGQPQTTRSPSGDPQAGVADRDPATGGRPPRG